MRAAVDSSAAAAHRRLAPRRRLSRGAARCPQRAGGARARRGGVRMAPRANAIGQNGSKSVARRGGNGEGLRDLLGHEAVAGTMEAVAPDAVLPREVQRERVPARRVCWRWSKAIDRLPGRG
jgi:hypothetical protein